MDSSSINLHTSTSASVVGPIGSTVIVVDGAQGPCAVSGQHTWCDVDLELLEEIAVGVRRL